MFKNAKLSTKVHIPMIVTMVIGLLVVLIYSYSVVKDVKKEVYEEIGQKINHFVQNSLKENEIFVKTSSIYLSDSAAVKQDLLTGNREMVLKALQMMQQNVRAHSHFKTVKYHVHTKDLHSFVRSWAPQKFGDDLSGFRLDLVKLKQVQKPMATYNVSRVGLVLRGLAPIYDQGNYIGSIETILGFDKLIQDAQKQHLVVGILMDKKYLSIASKVQSAPYSNGFVWVGGSQDPQFKGALNELKALKTGEVQLNDFLGFIKPIRDVNQNVIGYLVVAESNADAQKVIEVSTHGLYMQIAAMVIADLLVLFTLLWIVKRMIVKPIQELDQLAAELASGEVQYGKRLPVNSTDEIGEASRNFNQFIEKVEGLAKEAEAKAEEANRSEARALESMRKSELLVDLSNSMIDGSIHNASNIQGSMTHAIDNIRDVNQLNAKTGGVISEVTDNTEEIIDKLHSMRELADQSKQKATELDSSVNEIGNVINLIKDISEQTNLLALNAAIEAARAGEYGRGFAVVAEEGRDLANRTQKAAQEVEQNIEQLREHSSEMVHTGERNAENANESIQKLGGFRQTLNDLVLNANQIASDNRKISYEMFTNLAKLDHLVFKTNAYASIFREKLQAQFSDHHSCRLGKWYDQGEGHQYLSGSPSYGQIEAPHKRVHDHVLHALQCVETHRCVENKESVVADFHAAESASRELFAILDRVVHEAAEEMDRKSQQMQSELSVTYQETEEGDEKTAS